MASALRGPDGGPRPPARDGEAAVRARSEPRRRTPRSSSSPETTLPPTTTTTIPTPRSPLTGVEVPADADQGRPALAVKIDNHPDAVPQVGLDQTDIVFEERVEGITRFLAVFWAHDVAGVGPIRSARTSDIDLLGSLGQPLLAWSGGNEGVVDAVASSDVIDVGFDHQPDLYYREPSRSAPHNLMSDTAALVAAGREGASPPQAPFAVAQGAPPPAGTVVAPGLDVNLDGVTATGCGTPPRRGGSASRTVRPTWPRAAPSSARPTSWRWASTTTRARPTRRRPKPSRWGRAPAWCCGPTARWRR